MKHRIRAAGILVGDDGRLLLVLEKYLAGGGALWVPPGGGLEAEDGSAVSCVRREFLEETGLSVEVGRLVYVREFVETSAATHHLELFFRVHKARGRIHAVDKDEPPVGAELRRYARWFSRGELPDIRVAPPELRQGFWDDVLAGATETRYLGVSVENTA